MISEISSGLKRKIIRREAEFKDKAVLAALTGKGEFLANKKLNFIKKLKNSALNII